MNPVDVAENAATLDHLSHGRFILGMSVGYREKELQAVGVTIYSLPPTPRERIEYLQMIAEEIVAKVAEPSDAAARTL